MATRLQRIIFNSGAWMRRQGRALAVMPISVTVEGDADALVPDLCRSLAAGLDLTYGETVIPEDAAPRGAAAGGEHVKGALIITTDPNQPQPAYTEGNPEPDVSEVRLLLQQAITSDLDDLDTFVTRRREVRRLLSRLSGQIP